MKSSSTIFLLTLSALLIDDNADVETAQVFQAIIRTLLTLTIHTIRIHTMITRIIRIHTMVTRTIHIHILLPLQRIL